MPVLAGTLALAASLVAVPSSYAALREVGSRRLDARLLELTLRTDALRSPTRVRVLLPSGYRSAHRRFPVLYLLHGALNDERAWTSMGDAERLTAGLPIIVVMPNSGTRGGYADWYNNGHGGPPRWERYHIDQLLPFVDHRFRTVATRAGRAVAGLSMGGFGAMSYAARHPDLFVAAAAFSGAVDTNDPLDIAVTGDEPFGPRATEELRWRGHNPWDLAGNLRGLALFVRTGDGRADASGPADVVEQVVHSMSVSFHHRLQALRIPHVWDDYGPGRHQWPFWQRDLRRTLPSIMKAFARPPRPPAHITFSAVERAYRAYGWSLRWRRKPRLAFTTLHDGGAAGFRLTGAGNAVVTTPPLRVPRGRPYSVAVRIGGRTAMRRDLRADAAGRLDVRVDLPSGCHTAVVRWRPRAR